MGSEMMRWIFFVGTMKKLSLWLCIWFWWRRVIVRVLKITKLTLKTVLNEGKSSILHRVVKSAHFCPQLRPLHPLSPNAPRWSAASRFVVFGRSAPRLAAIDNRDCY